MTSIMPPLSVFKSRMRGYYPAVFARCLILAAVLFAVPGHAPYAVAVDGHAALHLGWHALSSPQYIHPADGAIYYSFQHRNGSRVHLVVVNYQSGKWILKPQVDGATTPTSKCAEKNSAGAAINGGFFNLTDGHSTIYVIVDGQVVADPKTNKALTENPKLTAFLEQIYNRSEVRVLENQKGSRLIQIAAHDAPVEAGYKVLHSLQGGPQLLPQLTDRQEAFVRVDPDGNKVDAIGSARPASRTAFGITTDGYAMMVCVSGSGQDPESSGLTLSELAALLKDLGCSHALNLDGGASSTMYVQTVDPTGHAGRVVCGKNPETKVKSALLLLPGAN